VNPHQTAAAQIVKAEHTQEMSDGQSFVLTGHNTARDGSFMERTRD
jgi:hypothetical protein